MKDGEIFLEKMKKGSSTAFEEFYDHYCSFVFGIAMKILKNKSDAEDLCQDVFIEIFKNPTSYDPHRGSVDAWIAIKTKSRCLDRLRRKKQFALQTDAEILESISDFDTVENEVMTNADKELVHKALQNLSKPQRDVILGNYFIGLTHRELAEKLDRPLGTIKSLVRYGLHNLRKYFEQNGMAKARGEKNDM